MGELIIMDEDIKKEYEKIKELFNGVDSSQLSLLDGAIIEAARLKIELDNLRAIVKETGLVKVNPKNFTQQKELVVGKVLTKTRANYISYISKLSNLLGKDVDIDDEDLNEYE